MADGASPFGRTSTDAESDRQIVFPPIVAIAGVLRAAEGVTP